jgi:hypothetical protein
MKGGKKESGSEERKWEEEVRRNDRRGCRTKFLIDLRTKVYFL